MKAQVILKLKHQRKNSFLFGLLLFLLALPSIASSQCFIKSTDESSGYITYYMDPELVSQTDAFGAAFSVQLVAEQYYLAVTYQFSQRAQPVEERVAISLQNGYTIELDMYTMQVGGGSGVELCMAVFYLEDEQIQYLKKAPVSKIVFRTQDGQKHELPATSNQDVLIRQLKCFKK